MTWTRRPILTSPRTWGLGCGQRLSQGRRRRRSRPTSGSRPSYPSSEWDRRPWDCVDRGSLGFWQSTTTRRRYEGCFFSLGNCLLFRVFLGFRGEKGPDFVMVFVYLPPVVPESPPTPLYAFHYNETPDDQANSSIDACALGCVCHLRG